MTSGGICGKKDRLSITSLLKFALLCAVQLSPIDLQLSDRLHTSICQCSHDHTGSDSESSQGKWICFLSMSRSFKKIAFIQKDVCLY